MVAAVVVVAAEGSVPELAAWFDPPPQAASSATSPRSTVSFMEAFCY
jgi:hypothetical protein